MHFLLNILMKCIKNFCSLTYVQGYIKCLNVKFCADLYATVCVL